MALEYAQYLSDEMQELYFDNPRYEDLRKTIRTDNELIFAVRKNEIHIYYLGGRILKITKSRGGLKFAFDPKYAKKKKGSDGLEECANLIKRLNDNPGDVDLWVKHFQDLKDCIKRYRDRVSPNPERQLQQFLELANRDFNGEVIVIDNEYGARKYAARLTHLNRSEKETFGKFTESELAILESHEPRLTRSDVLTMTDEQTESLKLEYKLCMFDLVALFRGDDGKYKICLTELKKGDGATGGKAGIRDHVRDFKILTGTRRADIIKSVENLIEYKTRKEIGAIVNYPSGGIELDRENIYISILCYDLSSEGKIKNVETEIAQIFDEETKKILPYFHYNLSLKEKNGYKLRREDLLKNRI